MKNKKLTIACTSISLILVIFIVFIAILMNKGIECSSYEKYSTSITIDAISEDKISSILINAKYDGQTMSLNSTAVNKETYIVGDTLYYIDGNIIYSLEAKSSYIDLYEILRSFKHVNLDHKDSSYAYYTAVLDSKSVNKILESLHFGKKTTSKTLCKLTILNGYIDEFNIAIDDIEDYKEININIKFKGLDSSFKIDASKIYGSASLGTVTRYRVERTKENPYEVIK